MHSDEEASTPARQGIRLTLAYDGTAFCGWQRQPGQRTVQGELEAALARLDPSQPKTRGASRTDAGVHALGQVVGFDTTRPMPPEAFVHVLNRELDDDMGVKDASVCPVGYDPRYDSLGKLYRYVARIGFTRDPLSRHRAWQLPPTMARRSVPRATRRPSLEDWLDLTSMQEASAMLLGTHDFSAFRAADDPRENTVRTLTAVRILPSFGGDPAMLAIEVEGNAFLKNMVRVLAGTLIDVGRERFPPDHVRRLLETAADRAEAGLTAPAHGLTLVHVTLGRLALENR